MEKHYLAAILIAMIGFSAAVSDNLQSRTGLDFAEMSLNPAIVSSEDKVKVIIKDSSFQPSALTIASGARVEWHNQDGIEHTVVSDDQGSFNSGVIMPGKKYALTFDAPGVYGYHCSIHQGMQGKVTVIGAAFAGKGSGIGSTSPSWSELPMGSDRIAMAELQPLTGSQSSSTGLQMQKTSPAITTLPVLTSAQTTSGDASSQISLQKFSSYYRMDAPESEARLTSATEIDLDDVAPQMIYFGSAQKAVPYSQYQSYASSTGANSLWISGTNSWTQYAVVPFGSHLNAIATSPTGGYGSLYKIYPDGALDKDSYSFYTYNLIGFYADRLGEHQLFFNIAGQPSNVIVINVVPYQQITPSYDYAAVTVRSAWMRGYNLYVDGSYAATEGMSGEEAGVLTINVPGDQYHNIAIDGSGMTFSDYKYFQAGYAYQLNV